MGLFIEAPNRAVLQGLADLRRGGGDAPFVPPAFRWACGAATTPHNSAHLETTRKWTRSSSCRAAWTREARTTDRSGSEPAALRDPFERPIDQSTTGAVSEK